MELGPFRGAYPRCLFWKEHCSASRDRDANDSALRALAVVVASTPPMSVAWRCTPFGVCGCLNILGRFGWLAH